MLNAKNYDPNSISNLFRARRFILLKNMIDEVIMKKKICRILDLGGTPEYWEVFGADLNWKALEIHVLNLTARSTTNPSIKLFVGDARDVSGWGDFSFDVVHSNSVIEHVGRWDDMACMAKEVRRLASRYFVQTPYFWFPIEPHVRFPFWHWMPECWRYRLLMTRGRGFWQKRPDVGSATRAVQSACLLDKKQMQFLFPDAQIVHERIFGLTKSIIAIRRSYQPVDEARRTETR